MIEITKRKYTKTVSSCLKMVEQYDTEFKRYQKGAALWRAKVSDCLWNGWSNARQIRHYGELADRLDKEADRCVDKGCHWKRLAKECVN